MKTDFKKDCTYGSVSANGSHRIVDLYLGRKKSPIRDYNYRIFSIFGNKTYILYANRKEKKLQYSFNGKEHE